MVPVEAVTPVDPTVSVVATVAVAVPVEVMVPVEAVDSAGSAVPVVSIVAVGEVAGGTVPKPTPGGMEPEEGASVDDAVA